MPCLNALLGSAPEDPLTLPLAPPPPPAAKTADAAQIDIPKATKALMRVCMTNSPLFSNRSGEKVGDPGRFCKSQRGYGYLASLSGVIPAQAGIQTIVAAEPHVLWISACAGMTMSGNLGVMRSTRHPSPSMPPNPHHSGPARRKCRYCPHPTFALPSQYGQAYRQVGA